jgi:hypothetical protein
MAEASHDEVRKNEQIRGMEELAFIETRVVRGHDGYPEHFEAEQVIHAKGDVPRVDEAWAKRMLRELIGRQERRISSKGTLHAPRI